MIRDDLAPPLRRKVIAVMLAFAAGGFLAVWLGLADLLPFVRSVARQVPVVAFRTSGLTALPLSISLFAFAGMCLIPVPRDDRRSREDRGTAAGTWRFATMLLGVAAAGVILSAVIAPVARRVASDALPRRGYVPCPDGTTDERRPPLRWRVPTGHCPGVPVD